MPSQQYRHLGFVYAAFGLVLMAALAMRPTVPLGMGILASVLFFNIIFPLAAIWGQHHEWLRLWIFLVPLSILMVLPDWFLSSQLGVLVFPETGSPYFGTVPIFMAGMWTIPLILIVWIADHTTGWMSYIIAGVLSALLFVGSEATLWQLPVWHAQDVRQIQHVALYVIVPEIILGLSALAAYRWGSRRGILSRFLAAYVVMIVYLGNVALAYFLIERVGSFTALFRSANV